MTDIQAFKDEQDWIEASKVADEAIKKNIKAETAAYLSLQKDVQTKTLKAKADQAKYNQYLKNLQAFIDGIIIKDEYDEFLIAKIDNKKPLMLNHFEINFAVLDETPSRESNMTLSDFESNCLAVFAYNKNSGEWDIFDVTGKALKSGKKESRKIDEYVIDYEDVRMTA